MLGLLTHIETYESSQPGMIEDQILGEGQYAQEEVMVYQIWWCSRGKTMS